MPALNIGEPVRYALPMARLIKVECPQCGAALDIGRMNQSVTCRFCDTPFWIQSPKAAVAPPAGQRVVHLTSQQSAKLVGGLFAFILGSLGAFLVVFALGFLAIVAATFGLIWLMSRLK